MEEETAIRPPLIRLGEGFRGTTYRSADGLAVRVPRDAVAMERQRHLMATLEVLAPRIGTLSIPKPCRILPPSGELPFGALCYPAIAGRLFQPRDITARNRAPLARQLAAFLAELHAIAPARFGHLDLPHTPGPPEELHRRWRRCASYLRDALPRARFASVGRWYAASIARLAADPPPTGLVHGDFWHENLLFDGTALVGVVDFESVGLGPPIADFLTLDYASPALRAAMVREYRSLRPGFAYDTALARRLLGLRELAGLDHGLESGAVDADQVAKIVGATGAAEPRYRGSGHDRAAG